MRLVSACVFAVFPRVERQLHAHAEHVFSPFARTILIRVEWQLHAHERCGVDQHVYNPHYKISIIANLNIYIYMVIRSVALA